MHELRIGKLNSTLLSEIIKDGDEQRVNRLLGNFSQLYHFKFAGQYFSGQSMIHITLLLQNLDLNVTPTIKIVCHSFTTVPRIFIVI